MMETVPRIPPLDRPATYEDLVRVPDTMVAEIVDGELHASPRPALRHATVSSVMGGALIGPYHRGIGGPGGWWILDEPELHFDRDVLVPDLAGWRRERLPRIGDAKFATVAPDWVCEVLSPSTASLDRAKKLRIYAREGVARVWLADPGPRTLEALCLDAARWTILATYAGADVVRAEPFTDIELPIQALWDDEDA